MLGDFNWFVNEWHWVGPFSRRRIIFVIKYSSNYYYVSKIIIIIIISIVAWYNNNAPSPVAIRETPTSQVSRLRTLAANPFSSSSIQTIFLFFWCLFALSEVFPSVVPISVRLPSTVQFYYFSAKLIRWQRRHYHPLQKRFKDCFTTDTIIIIIYFLLCCFTFFSSLHLNNNTIWTGWLVSCYQRRYPAAYRLLFVI